MKKIALFMVTILMIPICVYADSITLSCPTEITSGSEFTCEVIGNSSDYVTSLRANIAGSSELSFVSFIPNSIWQGDGEGGRVTLYGGQAKDNFKIGVVKFKHSGNNDASISIDNIFFFNNSKKNAISSVSKVIPLKSTNTSNTDNNGGNNNNNTNKKDDSSNNNDNSGNQVNTNGNIRNNNTGSEQNNDEIVTTSPYLVDLVISNYNINFSKNIFEYNLTINDEDSLIITPTLEDNSSTLEIVGNKNLVDGSVISINITTTDNVTKTYALRISKEQTNDKKNYSIVFIVIIALLVIINIIRLILSRGKKNEE